mmetsp:Transcript_54877/g.158779  ORF Transcript_54877/g.158779 Transcript_54877/m.158779 type:complete len:265 (+) Transcript_54877:2205-2999(+)
MFHLHGQLAIAGDGAYQARQDGLSQWKCGHNRLRQVAWAPLRVQLGRKHRAVFDSLCNAVVVPYHQMLWPPIYRWQGFGLHGAMCRRRCVAACLLLLLHVRHVVLLGVVGRSCRVLQSRVRLRPYLRPRHVRGWPLLVELVFRPPSLCERHRRIEGGGRRLQHHSYGHASVLADVFRHGQQRAVRALDAFPCVVHRRRRVLLRDRGVHGEFACRAACLCIQRDLRGHDRLGALEAWLCLRGVHGVSGAATVEAFCGIFAARRAV